MPALEHRVFVSTVIGNFCSICNLLLFPHRLHAYRDTHARTHVHTHTFYSIFIFFFFFSHALQPHFLLYRRKGVSRLDCDIYTLFGVTASRFVGSYLGDPGRWKKKKFLISPPPTSLPAIPAPLSLRAFLVHVTNLLHFIFSQSWFHNAFTKYSPPRMNRVHLIFLPSPVLINGKGH